VLVVRKGPQLGERFYLEGSQLTIGRDPDSGIFLNDITVSRSHAVLDMNGSSVEIRDTGSLNGTFVNGNYIDSTVLIHGDIVQVGTFQMAFFAAKDSRR
jgi:pSer/pThr/pTyr-binding forkhead associated (FHA) protein